MARVFLSLGSNIEPERHVRAALTALEDTFGPLRVSPVYRTPAVGFHGDPFLNLAVALETDLPPQAVHTRLGELETALGRRRDGPRFSARTMDIDLLLHGDTVLSEGRLVLPRPEILTQAFVLVPLCDLAPDLVHPTEGRPLRELLAALDYDPADLEPVSLD